MARARRSSISLAAAALYTSAGYLVTLIFSFINLMWPDPGTTPYAQLQSEADRLVIPEALAGVFVAFPLLVDVQVTL